MNKLSAAKSTDASNKRQTNDYEMYRQGFEFMYLLLQSKLRILNASALYLNLMPKTPLLMDLLLSARELVTRR